MSVWVLLCPEFRITAQVNVELSSKVSVSYVLHFLPGFLQIWIIDWDLISLFCYWTVRIHWGLTQSLECSEETGSEVSGKEGKTLSRFFSPVDSARLQQDTRSFCLTGQKWLWLVLSDGVDIFKSGVFPPAWIAFLSKEFLNYFMCLDKMVDLIYSARELLFCSPLLSSVLWTP